MALPITTAQPQITQAEHQALSDLRAQAVQNVSAAAPAVSRGQIASLEGNLGRQLSPEERSTVEDNITRAYAAVIHLIASPGTYTPGEIEAMAATSNAARDRIIGRYANDARIHVMRDAAQRTR